MSPKTRSKPKGSKSKGSKPKAPKETATVEEKDYVAIPEDVDRDTISRTDAEVIGTSPIERTDAAPGIFPGAGPREIVTEYDPSETDAIPELDRLGEDLSDREELLTVNMGPHHPATHGVLRLLVSLEGEVVRDLKPIVGYLHTGIEKSCEKHSYWKVIPFVERMDYLSYFFSMEAYCGAVEKLLGIEIPPRAKWLRVLHMELNRIHSHLVWLGTTALDLGAMSMFWYCFRERDKILDLFEMSTGQRMHTRYFQVGGVFEDIPVGFERKVRDFCEEMPTRIDQYMALLDRNEIFLRRTKDVGIVSRERLLELGVTGPLLRAAGEPWDLRKVQD
ncbi:MAG: NADH-quinone oxidoreductase subunit D, partial [Solirubrobacterales bacterium]